MIATVRTLFTRFMQRLFIVAKLTFCHIGAVTVNGTVQLNWSEPLTNLVLVSVKWDRYFGVLLYYIG